MKQKYTMTDAARAARMKGAQATAQKFANYRAKCDQRAVVRLSRALRNWCVDRFGNVELAVAELKEIVEFKDREAKGVL